jgi:hypothetical protein
MNSMQQMSGDRHEYHLKGWQRFFFAFLGGSVAAGGFLLASEAISEPGGAVIAAIVLSLPILGLYVLAWALRSRLVIDGTRIEVRGALKERTVDLSEIEGFRMISAQNGTYTQICLKEGRGKIAVSQSFNTDDNYRAWFQQLADLDARDCDKLLEEISHDAELGSTPEERMGALKQAEIRNYIAMAVALAAAIGMNVGPNAHRLPVAVILALVPVAVLMMMQGSPLLYALFKKKSDPRADAAFVLIISGFGLAFSAADIEFISMKPLFPLMIPVALIYIATLYGPARKSNALLSVFLGVLFVSLPYSFGIAVVANCLADSAKPSTYIVPVTGKHATSGKSTTYYLELAPWGPVEKPNNLSVSSSFYGGTQPGDQICLALHPGRLHAPWYQLADCPAQPASEPTQ